VSKKNAAGVSDVTRGTAKLTALQTAKCLMPSRARLLEIKPASMYHTHHAPICAFQDGAEECRDKAEGDDVSSRSPVRNFRQT